MDFVKRPYTNNAFFGFLKIRNGFIRCSVQIFKRLSFEILARRKI